VRVLIGDVLCVDVDDTLVSWSPVADHELEHCVPFERETPNPVLYIETIDITFDGVTKKYWLYRDNVESVKTHHHKGRTIVVWSGSGAEWAEAVVKAVGLQEFVTVVMAKPRWLLDDMKPADFLPTPYWGLGDPGKAKLK
jgi:hypothetical protein